jgi:hypothetical protein
MNGYESAIALEPAWADAHYGRSKILYQKGKLIEACTELTVTFRLDLTKLKQYETEFPDLSSEQNFKQLDALIRESLMKPDSEEE